MGFKLLAFKFQILDFLGRSPLLQQGELDFTPAKKSSISKWVSSF
jgi:hypothetical protein